MPSFAENVGNNKAGLESLIARLPSVRDKRLIVFDVRGNHGGNSFWGEQLVASLFGKEYVDKLSNRIGATEFIQWRASKGNADFIEKSTLPRFDSTSERYRSIAAIVREIRSAVREGRALTVAPRRARAARVEPAPPHPLATKVILLTDGWCASACLDFTDLVLAIPGVRHAGAATYADAVYIDNRSIRLPSDLGWFGFSMKVYRGRPRGHNQPYVPSIVYRGTIWNSATLQQWLIESTRGNVSSPRQ